MKRANENDKDIWYVYAYDSEGDFVLIKDYDDISVKPLVGYKFNHDMENKPTVTTTDIINHAKVFYEKNDAEKLIKWLKNNWVILNDEMVDYDDLKVGYKDKYDNIYDILTDKVVYINDDGDEIGESMEFNEARKFLNENGYQLIDEALEGPATSKQLWTLFKLTHKDYRGQDLSKQAASDMIGELLGKKKNGDTTPKPRKAPASDENSPVKVGEIYHRSWGYDMTINTYFKVLSVKGKSAMVIELQKDVVKGCMQQGYVVANNSPDKGAVPQKALIKDDGTIKVKHYSDKYETYRKWDGKPDYEDHMD